MRRLAAAGLLTLALAGCGSAPPGAPSGTPVDVLRIGLSEYRLQLSAGAVLPGRVLVTATNAGSAAHDVRLRQGQTVLGATRLLAPGEKQTLEVEAVAGLAIDLDCTVPGHAEAGMVTSLQVAPG